LAAHLTRLEHFSLTVLTYRAETEPTAAEFRNEARGRLHCLRLLLARFFFVGDPDGYQIEVLQRHGRYQ